MSAPTEGSREGSLDAPTRHPLDWRSPEFYDETTLLKELERVYDICHGCRRCFSLCNAFPHLFNAIDASPSGEVDTVSKTVFWEVVDHCYLCDLCYMTKCPYVPPHPWNIDFPHLMLRAKAVKFRRGAVKTRDRILSATDAVGQLAGIPIVNGIVNAVGRSGGGRKVLEKTLGVHPKARVPEYHSDTLRKRAGNRPRPMLEAKPLGRTRGKVALYATCYCNYNEPGIGEDLIAVFEHNGIPVTLAPRERCCGMPKLEIGDLDTVRQLKEANVPVLAGLVDDGYDIVAAVPSCVLMYKQELPLMFPDDPQVRKVREAIFDPFEYLMLRHREGGLDTGFRNKLGKLAYHASCHLRVQNIGMKTRELLALVPDTQFEMIERCSGHDGTYAVKNEYHEIAMKLCKPIVSRVRNAAPDHYTSDCPMAGHHIANGLGDGSAPLHPLTLLRMAYGI